MSNDWDQRKGQIRKAMRLGPLEADPTFDQSAYRGVIMPSFHSDLAITLLIDPYESHLELAVLTHAGRERALKSPTSHLRASRDASAEQRRWRAKFVVPPERAAAFARHVSTLDPVADETSGWMVMDGADVEGTIIDAKGTREFQNRGAFPDGETAQHTFFGSLHQLAMELAIAAGDTKCEFALDEVHGYLGLGLSLRDRGGVPRQIRIFGWLMGHHEAQLGNAFNALPNSEPLLLDMSNLDTLMTTLYPLFRTLGQRSAPLVYWASPHAQKHLLAIGVAPDAIFDRIEDALAALTAASAR